MSRIESFDPPVPAITVEEFHKFREFFYRKTGIRFEDSKRYFVDKRLIDRIVQTGCDDFRSYYALLRFETGGAELQQLINLMTVNETYFLREEYQFKALVESILPDVVARKRDRQPIRIWCVPSSSGEEAYSIAMYLLERWPGLADWDVEIISSDIDTNMIAKARIGRYSPRAVQYVPRDWLRKYFSRTGDDYQLCASIRQSVEFTRCNISEAADMRGYRDFDLIFCRNLLIYFDDLSRKAAAEALYDALKPEGFLCLGHSESMSRISSLYRVRKFPEALVYQKPKEVQ